MKLPDRIRTRRIELNLTQAELAQKMGYKSRSSINKIELGISDITQSKIMEFANVLDCSPEYLMGWDDENVHEDDCIDLESKKVFANNLNYYLKKFNKDRKQVCNDLNIKYSTFSEWVNSKKYPRIDKIELLANYFGIIKSDLIENKQQTDITPYNPIVHKIPVLGYISAGLPLYAEEHITDYTYTERNGGAEYFALKVKGDSMSAAQINDGNIIIVRKQDIVEDGEIAVIRVDDEDATVKRFKRVGDIVQLIPQSYNPEHEIQIYDLKNTDIQIIGKVVECKIEF